MNNTTEQTINGSPSARPNQDVSGNLTTHGLKVALRAGKYAWPGGYPCYFVTDDGCALSFEAVRENFRAVLASVKHHQSDGWRVLCVDVNYEDPELFCEHTGNRIESAYAEDRAN